MTTDQKTDVEASKRISDMLESAKRHESLSEVCIHEIECLMDRLRSKNKPLSSSGIPSFVRALRRDTNLLQTLTTELSDAHLDESSLAQFQRRLDLSTTAVSRSLAQWDRLRRCRGIVAVNQAFQGSSRDGRRKELARRDVVGREKEKMHRLLKEQGRVEVDVVEDGEEWLAVKAVTRDRLARQMSDSGWAWGEHSVGDVVDEDEWDDVPLAKFVRRLVTAARMNRHEYLFPRIRLIIPNLDQGEDELDIFFFQISHMDPLVKITIEYQNSPFITDPQPLLPTALDNLVTDDLAHLTQTINLDHTVLIDLISDLTHSKLEPQRWQERTTRMQIEEENAYEDGLMARTLYPVLAGRKLMCTREAAEHFHNVLKTVGTETERERGRLVVPWGDTATASPESIRQRFQQLSIHTLPADVQIPLTIVTEEWTSPSIDHAITTGQLPLVARSVVEASGFKSAKLSIFIYGWAVGAATITSNKEVRGQMRTWVETHRKTDQEVGPQIWRIEVTRNLLAKSASPRPGWVDRMREEEGRGKLIREVDE